MREILFRGKRADNGEWVEGSLTVNHYDRAGKLEDEYRIVDTCYGLDDEDFPTYQIGLEEAVAPSTVGQYTGLTDKNGKKIFEGDILEYDFGEDLYGVIGEPYKLGKRNATVYYSSKYHSFLLKPCGDFAFKEMNDGIVIGNIHDNPELIGGEKK